MPLAKTYKCGVCLEDIAKNRASVLCKNCSLWIHVSCTDLQEKALTLLKDSKSLSFTCSKCDKNPNSGMDKIREEVCAISSKLDLFIDKVGNDQRSIQQSLMDTVAGFRTEMTTCFKDMKAEILNCNKLIGFIDTSTTKRINTLEDENNVLYKRLNRADVIIIGLPAGLGDLVDPIIKIGSVYNIPISRVDINHAFYFKNQKAILVKFNNVFLRDQLMAEYFKTRTLRVCDVIGGEIESRIYLNDHHSPAAGRLNIVCKKLLRKGIIIKFKMLNGDKLRAKLTMADGKNVVCDSVECAALLNE